MAAQWRRVVEQLVAVLPTLSGWGSVAVYDGAPITGDNPVDYCTVGYVADDQAGNYTTTQDADGFQRDESGEVKSQLVCQTGDENAMPAMRDRVFDLADALDAYVRANRTLGGVLSPEGTSELVVDVLSVQNPNGTSQALVLTLRYTTVT